MASRFNPWQEKWKQYEGSIITGIKVAEKEIPTTHPTPAWPNSTRPCGLCSTPTPEANNGKQPSAALVEQIKQGIQIKHDELDRYGGLSGKGRSAIAEVAILRPFRPFCRGLQKQSRPTAKMPAVTSRPGQVAGQVASTGVSHEASEAVLPFLLPIVLLMGCGLCAVNADDLRPQRRAGPAPRDCPIRQVWVLDENGKPVAGKMDLPEGWYCLPVPPEDE